MNDKSKVSTDALETLGTKIGPDEKRDAIHLAVIPMQAKEYVRAGMDVNAEGRPDRPYVGIVDPFLKAPVMKGEWFWLVIYPRQITSLRHVWSHPAFPEETAVADVEPKWTKEESEQWLRAWVEGSSCPSYEFLLEIGKHGECVGPDETDYHGSADDQYLTIFGSDASGAIPPAVWDHVENIIGRKVAQRPQWFTCTC